MGLVKAVFPRKFIALNAYIGKEENYKMNHLSFHFKKPGKEEKIKPIVNKIKIIIKIKAEINKAEKSRENQQH